MRRTVVVVLGLLLIVTPLLCGCSESTKVDASQQNKKDQETVTDGTITFILPEGFGIKVKYIKSDGGFFDIMDKDGDFFCIKYPAEFDPSTKGSEVKEQYEKDGHGYVVCISDSGKVEAEKYCIYITDLNIEVYSPFDLMEQMREVAESIKYN